LLKCSTNSFWRGHNDLVLIGPSLARRDKRTPFERDLVVGHFTVTTKRYTSPAARISARPSVHHCHSPVIATQSFRPFVVHFTHPYNALAPSAMICMMYV
jgi:hypothetical protein